MQDGRATCVRRLQEADAYKGLETGDMMTGALLHLLAAGALHLPKAAGRTTAAVAGDHLANHISPCDCGNAKLVPQCGTCDGSPARVAHSMRLWSQPCLLPPRAMSPSATCNTSSARAQVSGCVRLGDMLAAGSALGAPDVVCNAIWDAVAADAHYYLEVDYDVPDYVRGAAECYAMANVNSALAGTDKYVSQNKQQARSILEKFQSTGDAASHQGLVDSCNAVLKGTLATKPICELADEDGRAHDDVCPRSGYSCRPDRSGCALDSPLCALAPTLRLTSSGGLWCESPFQIALTVAALCLVCVGWGTLRRISHRRRHGGRGGRRTPRGGRGSPGRPGVGAGGGSKPPGLSPAVIARLRRTICVLQTDTEGEEVEEEEEEEETAGAEVEAVERSEHGDERRNEDSRGKSTGDDGGHAADDGSRVQPLLQADHLAAAAAAAAAAGVGLMPAHGKLRRDGRTSVGAVCVVCLEALYASRFHSWLSILTEIHLCHACFCHEILRMENAWTGLRGSSCLCCRAAATGSTPAASRTGWRSTTRARAADSLLWISTAFDLADAVTRR
eukprot:COSAG01_NODE_4351_length_5111_cov_2.539689_9_plen_561_part_00